MARVFISYRREDSSADTLLIHERLAAAFGKDVLFLDITSLGAGNVFMKAISEALNESLALIAVIGKQWLTLKDVNDIPRIHSSNDILRAEIAIALQRGILVIPVLVGGAVMPTKELLPDDLKPLADRQFVAISYNRLDYDIKQLEDALRSEINLNPTQQRQEDLEQARERSTSNTQVIWKQNKVANLYWLGSDLMNTVLLAQIGGFPKSIIRGIGQSHWHAEELALDPVITGRLGKLLNDAQSYKDWNEEERTHIMQELSALINAVGFVVEAADRDYKPNRPNSPTMTKGLLILSAVYGANANWANVTETLNINIREGKLNIPVDNFHMVGSDDPKDDPNYGIVKSAKVTYKYDGVIYPEVIVLEGRTLQLPR